MQFGAKTTIANIVTLFDKTGSVFDIRKPLHLQQKLQVKGSFMSDRLQFVDATICLQLGQKRAKSSN